MRGGEIQRAELPAGGTVRAEVVVHDVQQNRQAETVRRIHEAAQVVGRSVRARRREETDAVVPPIARPRKVGDRHQLDDRHAEVGEIRKLPGHAGERAGTRECTDVQLVDDGVAKRDAAPRLVRPRESPRVDDRRRPVDACG